MEMEQVGEPELGFSEHQFLVECRVQHQLMAYLDQH
jgi:hypothetical protein